MRAAIDPETTPQSEPETVDLAAVGRQNVMPGPQVSADAEDLMSSLPWWVSRGLLYVVAAVVFSAVIWSAFAPIDDVAVARGSIIPEGQVRPIQALEAGTVLSVDVREGDKVTKGQTLVRLDDSVEQAKESEARLAYEGAQVNLISLRNSGADVGAINDAEANVTALKNNLDATILAVDRTRLTAPMDGTVTFLAVYGPGAVVSQGTIVADMAPAGARLIADVLIPNGQIARVRPGLPVKLLIDAYPYQQFGVFDGTVMTVSPDAIETNGESFYRAEVLPASTTLRSGVALAPGLALEARIVTQRRSIMKLFLDPFQRTGGS